MKRLFLLLCILTFSARAEAWDVIGSGGSAPAGFDCTGWTLCEDFSGTGAPASVLTSAGSPNYDATPPAAMGGGQALLLDGYTDSADTRVTFGITDTVGQDNSLYEGELLISEKGSASGSDSILVWYDNTVAICVVSVADINATTYSLRVQAASGGSLATVSDPLTIGTRYYVWARLIEGTADNAQCSIAFNTVQTEPTSGTKYNLSTGGTSEGSLDRIELLGEYTQSTDRWDVYWKNIRAKGGQ